MDKSQKSKEEKLKKVLDKIDSFKLLTPGWYYGKGVAATDEAIETAKNIIKRSDLLDDNLQITHDAFPVEDGSILLIFYVNAMQIYIEFFIENNGDYYINAIDYLENTNREKENSNE